MLVKGLDKLLSLDTRGTFARSGGFGKLQFSYNYFGFNTKWAGIYSGKKTKKGRGLSKMKFYRPSNPQTITQQNWRSVCAYAWVLWADFSDETKEQYKIKGKKLKMGGANYFMRTWLTYPTRGFGRIIFGYTRFGAS